VVVLGDTAADIVCAHDGGYRAVAVATGHYDMDHLRGHGPDALLADLSQRKDVFEAIGL
jgi:phosphoglycolate phosphatase-like HAD superfamily hydrolase